MLGVYIGPREHDDHQNRVRPGMPVGYDTLPVKHERRCMRGTYTATGSSFSVSMRARGKLHPRSGAKPNAVHGMRAFGDALKMDAQSMGCQELTLRGSCV